MVSSKLLTKCCTYAGGIFTLSTGSTALRFTEAGAPLAVRRKGILAMNQHA
jgi:hypothetical protein